jgi:hypothetical protein
MKMRGLMPRNPLAGSQRSFRAGSVIQFVPRSRLFLILLFLCFQGEETPAVKKPDTATMNPVDYSARVPKKDRERPIIVEEQEDDDEILNNLPPMNPEYRYVATGLSAPIPRPLRDFRFYTLARFGCRKPL